MNDEDEHAQPSDCNEPRDDATIAIGNHPARGRRPETLGVMRRRVLIAVGIVLASVAAYEATFRIVTTNCGGVEVKANPPRVYWLDDLDSPIPWRSICFGFRTQLPFGKVRLSKGTGAYVDGGRIYRRLSDGSWQDVTDAIVKYEETKQ